MNSNEPNIGDRLDESGTSSDAS